MSDWREIIHWLFSSREVPLTVKVLYTIFVCVLIPIYWRHYGAANFLWFSDIALLIGLVALWLENPLLASTQAVSVLVLEMVWIFDFVIRLTTGIQPVGIAEYMFKSDIPLFVRGLSLFHLVLPFLLVWLVYRLGYDQRAWIVQTVLFWVVLLLCFFFTEPSQNINWAFGPGNEPQQKIAPGFYLALLLVIVPVCVYLPTHFLLKELLSK
jgi:hypothetical protein